MIRKKYFDLTESQLHCAVAGNTGPRIVLLHESPLSHRIYFDVMDQIASWGQVCAPDTPGYGQSTPLTPSSSLGEYAARLIEGIKLWCNSEPVIVGGIHTGASLAVEIANQAPELCSGLFLIGLPTYTDEMRESRIKSYAPGVELTKDGAHLQWAWDRYINMWPAASLEHIQLAVADLFYNLERYNWAYLEAFKYRAEQAIENVRCPILMSAAEGEFLYDGTKALAKKHGFRFHSFPGVDWQGQVSLRNSAELNKALKDFAESL
jgi:haloalkane dehalogenase